MSIYYLPLSFSPAGKWACLREICGHDVLAINQPGTMDAIQLIDRLLVESSETDIRPGMAAVIATADRDEMLAAIYKANFGSQIESTIDCQACEEPFDLDFDCDQLLNFIRGEAAMAEVEKEEDGTFKLADGCRFRLPSGEDERLLFGLSEQQAGHLLLERCLLEGDAQANASNIQAAMQQIAPVFETDLQANCPECNHEQYIRFDMQSYLLNALLLEKKQLPTEVHRLAVTYGWSQQEILELPRTLRQRYVSLIIAESAMN